MKITGQVGKKPFGVGTKSERNAVYLKTADGEEYVLRQQDGNAFRDPELAATKDWFRA